MWPALAAVAEAGTLAACFLLGVLWERNRHPPPPSTHHVILTIDDPDD
jgi:hypothetical protein